MNFYAIKRGAEESGACIFIAAFSQGGQEVSSLAMAGTGTHYHQPPVPVHMGLGGDGGAALGPSNLTSPSTSGFDQLLLKAPCFQPRYSYMML